MINSRVCRGSSVAGECSDDDGNLKWGDDISDALLVTELAARERGRVEIDSSYTNRTMVDLNLHQNSFIQPGQQVTIVSGTESNTGLLKNIRINYNVSDNSVASGSDIRVERNT